MKKILIVSPHPDDEVLGCGGTILKHKKNKDKIYWIICTSINNSKNFSNSQKNIRSREIQKIINFFRFDYVYDLEYSTKEINQIDENKIIQDFTSIIKQIKPTTIYLPYINDAHSDHRIITTSFNACIKPFRYPFLEKIMMYETLSETNLNFLLKRKFLANVYNDISPFIKKKIKAINIFKSEISKHPFPRSEDSIKSLAILRGSEANFKYAEAFELVYQRIKN